MNWKAIARFATGTSHIKQQMPCQDYGDYKMIDDAIVGVVADGAGSAKHSDIGARLAVNTVLETISEQDIFTITELCNGDRFREVEKPKTSAWKPWNISQNNKSHNTAVAVAQSDSEQKACQPLEQYLRETENLESDKYLEDFLNSERLNARTNDDKTLFLCMYDGSSNSLR